jgi:DNA ligase-1
MTKDATALSVLSGTPLADQLSEADAVLRQVYSECPTWDLIVPARLSNGVMALPTTCHFVPGIPIKPMLAKATRGACWLRCSTRIAWCAERICMLRLTGVAEIVERFADVEFTCEYKYDGERAQVCAHDGALLR